MSPRAALGCLVFAFAVAACASKQAGGYDAADPTKLSCACGDANECYEAASALAEDKGENAGTGERLLVFAQCACFEGDPGGCNTISHFAKDAIAACDAGDDLKNSCTIAGYVFLHGVRVPPVNGRSFDADAAQARAHFERACQIGEKLACAKLERELSRTK